MARLDDDDDATARKENRDPKREEMVSSTVMKRSRGRQDEYVASPGKKALLQERAHHLQRLKRLEEQQVDIDEAREAEREEGEGGRLHGLQPSSPSPHSSQQNGHNSSQTKPSAFLNVLEDFASDEPSSAADEENGYCATEDQQNWSRPPLARIDPNKDTVTFQQIEIDDALDNARGPTLRLYGVNEVGNSVVAHVHEFLPYFWVAAPPGFSNVHLEPLALALDHAAGGSSWGSQSTSYTRKTVERCQLFMKRNIYGYISDSRFPFIKIVLSDPKAMGKVKGIFERADAWSGMRPLNGVPVTDFWSSPVTTFESNIAYVLRFMIDLGIQGMSWLSVKAGGYEVRQKKFAVSSAQLEIDCSFKSITAHQPVGEWAKTAPFRILSYDIECAGRKGIFPEPDIDPVIQIANMVTIQGDSKPRIRNVFTLNTCAHIVGTQILSFDNEAKMLLRWRQFFVEADPDLVIGYNISNFDWPYLLDRARRLEVKKFPFLGRMTHVKTEITNTHFSSKAYGQRDSKIINLEGRLQFDILQVMQRDYKLRSYTLNAVCAHFLGEQKEDVHHSVITELQNGTPDSRRRLAVYCLKDAYLPQRLLDKLMSFVNYTEMARVTGVPFNYLLTRGQQIKVVSQLFRKARAEDYVIPAMSVQGSDEQYEGATVIEPTKGYYDVPIATLDFSSLYPSIMMAHNLCYTTLINNDTIAKMNLQKDVDYIVTPSGDQFVKATRRKGLLAIILEDLLSARKRAKADLKVEKDAFTRAVLDGRQLALKVSANSVYGFTGATVGKLPCLPISTSTTAFGREMIMKTKEEVESRYCTANGYAHDAQVIYGDTDSVMVKFGTAELAEAMKLGAEAAALVTQKFIKPIQLEFEKVYFPYLLISKKRYAGLYWTNPSKYDKMDAKGIETVRRDNCRLVQVVIETCLRKMLIDRDVEGAVTYTKQMISDLLQNKVDMSQLVITKALSKTEYAGKQAHVELAERMKKRDAGSAPALGDRVAYVIIRGTKDAAAYEKSEDPIYVLENNIPIDTRYYLDNQLSKPLMRIFEPIMGDKATQLLAGEHTRTIAVTTPNIGGLMKFAVRTITCAGCKAPLKASEKVVCVNCRSRLGELYEKQLSKTNELEVAFSRLWVTCQRCQKSLHQDVLCSSSDCPIFYQRKKAQHDVTGAYTSLDRFGIAW